MTGRLVGRSCKSGVAAAAQPTFSSEQLLTNIGQIGQFDGSIFGHFIDDGAHWHFEFEVAAVTSTSIRTLTMCAAPRTKLRMKSVVNQCVVMGTGDDVNGASTATIAAVRTSSRDELLSAKTQAASTAVAGGDVNVDFVDEHEGVRAPLRGCDRAV